MPELKPVQFDIPTVIEWDVWKQECVPRLKRASKLEIPHLPEFKPHEGVCAIVGGGPSVKAHLNQIESIKAGPLNLVMPINGAHAWLLEHNVTPTIQVVFESDLKDVKMALGGPPYKGVTYYICSHCNPFIFRQLGNFRQVLWHAFCPPQGYQRAIAKYFPNEFMVAGGYSTFFRVLNIAIILGYREFDLFGCDSSFEASSHVDGYARANIEPKVKVWGLDPNDGSVKPFTTQGGLAFQATEFVKFCTANQAGLRLRVHGDGLLHYLHQARYPEQYQQEN